MKKQLFNDENFNTDEIRQKNLAYDISFSSFHMSLSMLLRIEDWLNKMNVNVPKSELKSFTFPEAKVYSYTNPQ